MRRIALFALATAIALFFVILRYPQPGQVLHYAGAATAQHSSTVLLLRLNDCLVLSWSGKDIGKKLLTDEDSGRAFQIVADDHIESIGAGASLALRSEVSNLTAVPGQPFEGVITFRRKSAASAIEELFEYKWVTNDDCGANLAIVSSIDRVQDIPTPLVPSSKP